MLKINYLTINTNTEVNKEAMETQKEEERILFPFTVD